jgi:hypothetical protein
MASAIALLFAAALPAQQPQPASAKKPSPAQAEYEKLTKDLERERAEFAKRMRELQQTDAYKKAVEERDREALTKLTSGIPKVDMAPLAKRAQQLAGKFAGGDEAVPFLTFVVLNSPDRESSQDAFDRLMADHMASPRLIELAERGSMLRGKLGEKGIAALDQLAEGQTHPHVKAYALYLKYQLAQRDRNMSAEAKEAAAVGLKKAEELASDNPELYDRIVAPRFEKERLQIGMEAPDIAGRDLDGAGFKLSDYRGKVVVLDFWGDW